MTTLLLMFALLFTIILSVIGIVGWIQTHRHAYYSKSPQYYARMTSASLMALFIIVTIMY